MRANAPDAIIKTTRNPLSDQVPSLLGLYEVLITVHVRDVPKSLSFNLMTRSMSAEDESNVR